MLLRYEDHKESEISYKADSNTLTFGSFAYQIRKEILY